MNPNIRKYDPKEDETQLFALIESEGDEWDDYLNKNNRPKYQMALEQSITYVAYVGDKLCGYSRSRHDFGLYIWVIDLLVHQNYRGHAIGKQLLECITTDFPNRDVFVMSDADGYYKKQGYAKEGSIFKIG